VASLITSGSRGQFLKEGTPLAVFVNGAPVLRTWLNEEQLGSISREPGATVQFRIPGHSTTTHTGTIVAIKPAAEHVFDKIALTYLAGGEILVDPATGRPLEPVFRIDIQPQEEVLQLAQHGARVTLQLPRRYESIAAWAVRKCTRFVQKLLTA
jgi:putative peptide zinc metalloprotease protein